jgi:uncharacterized protein
MKRSFLPEKLDVAHFCRDGASLSGAWPASSLERLSDAAAPEAPAAGWPELTWHLQGEAREQRAAPAQLWLQVKAQATVKLTCQRCLHPVEDHLAVDRWIRFVDDEATAADLDADSEDDVLALPRHLDARELIEDAGLASRAPPRGLPATAAASGG